MPGEPWTEEPGGLQSIGSQRVGHDWASNTHLLPTWPRHGPQFPPYPHCWAQGPGPLRVQFQVQDTAEKESLCPFPVSLGSQVCERTSCGQLEEQVRGSSSEESVEGDPGWALGSSHSFSRDIISHLSAQLGPWEQLSRKWPFLAAEPEVLVPPRDCQPISHHPAGLILLLVWGPTHTLA